MFLGPNDLLQGSHPVLYKTGPSSSARIFSTYKLCLPPPLRISSLSGHLQHITIEDSIEVILKTP